MKRGFNIDNGTVQTTLDGIKLRFPKVRTSDGHMLEWDKEAIVKQLLRETKLSQDFYDSSPIDEATAREIAEEASKRIRVMGISQLSGALVREVVNQILLEEYHKQEWRNVCTRVGTPVYDAHLIDIGEGFEAKENANLQENAETSHKKKADKICKEQYLLLLPPELSDAHLSGDLHIHDLEYFGTRGFCQDWDLRYFFYYGLMPDGSGTKASVAGPAKKAEVAILHAVKILGSAQTNFAGGQGFFNFLTFIAPYLEGLSYEEIEQLMQMFVYEMTQMQVARGGQLVFSSIQLTPGVPKIWKDKPVVYKGEVWNGEREHVPFRSYSEFEREVRLSFKALMNVMLQGDYWGKPFNFPKPEIVIDREFLDENCEDTEFRLKNQDQDQDQDQGLPTYGELYDLAFELTAKYGTPYFDNSIPDYRGADEGVSCYQCLAKDELIPIIEDGNVKVDYISSIFEKSAVDCVRADGGVEFVELNAMTPSMKFGDFSVRPRQFKGIMRKKYRGELLNIILESGRRITVTPDHPLFIYRSGGFERIEANRLTIGDYLPLMKHVAFVCMPAARSIDLEDVLVAGGYSSEITVENGRVNVLHAKKEGFSKTLRVTPELVRFLGYYLSEGCSDHSGRRYSVRLSFGKDEADLINDAKRCISIGLGIDPIISIESTAVNVTINSKLLYLLLDALGCGHTANDKSVPDLLFNVEPSLVGEYLYGVFAGDGNVDSRVNTVKNAYGKYKSHANMIRLKLVSRSAVQKLVLLAQRIDVQMNYYERLQKTTHPQTKEIYFLPTFIASISAQDQIQKFSDAVGYGSSAIRDRAMHTAGVFNRIPIKESGLNYSNLTYATQYHSGGYARVNQSLIDTEGSHIVHNLVKSDIHVLRVKKIEEIGYDDYVYDLVDVEDTHNFCNALGIITGNCCAYNFKTSPDDADFHDKMYFRNGKHFSMGGWQVITLNCPRAAYIAGGDDNKLFAELKRLMDCAVKIFKVKRRWMDQIIKSERMPFATQRPRDTQTGEKGSMAVYLDELVYIIGVTGINEMVQYHYGKQIHEEEGALRFAIRAMTEMELYVKELSRREDIPISFSRTPAETVVQRFAVADILQKEFRDKALTVVKGDIERTLTDINETRDLPIYYTNGTHVSQNADISLADRIKTEHIFFPIVDGGNIMHIFLGEGYPDPRGIKSLALKIAKDTQTGYFAFTKDMTVCMDCSHVTMGLKAECEKCESKKIDHISRITGYLQAVSGWNEGKKQELLDRMRYGADDLR